MCLRGCVGIQASYRRMKHAQAWDASWDVCLAGRNRSLGSEPEPQRYSKRTRAEQLDSAPGWFGRRLTRTKASIDLQFFLRPVR